MRAATARCVREEHQDLEALRRQWTAHYGGAPPPNLRRSMLARALAYRLQVEAAGDLSPRLKKELRTIARASSSGAAVAKGCAAGGFRPGARIVRVWRGELYEVRVQDDGFLWRGELYGSLSQVAREITGTRWNGLTFFGLRGAGARKVRARV